MGWAWTHFPSRKPSTILGQAWIYTTTMVLSRSVGCCRPKCIGPMDNDLGLNKAQQMEGIVTICNINTPISWWLIPFNSLIFLLLSASEFLPSFTPTHILLTPIIFDSTIGIWIPFFHFIKSLTSSRKVKFYLNQLAWLTFFYKVWCKLGGRNFNEQQSSN